MKSIIIKNGNLVLPDRVLDNSDILIESGKIKSIGKDLVGDYTIDAKGQYVLPGFVDVHVHGGGGADFMDATCEAFETAVRAHLSHGTTTLVPTAMSATEQDLTDFLNCFNEFKNTSKYADITPGVHLEGPYFSGATAKSGGAQPRGVLRLPDFDEIGRLLKASNGSILRWDAAPELEGSDRFAALMNELGIVPAMAHSNADSFEAQKGIDSGFKHVTHFYNAVTSYHKVGQKPRAGLVEAVYLNPGVTVELICDGRHIPRDIVRLALMIKGADKVSAITDGMRIAGTDMQSGKLGSLKNGTDVIVDDDVAKLVDMSSFAGSIATMDRCLRVLCGDYGIDIVTAAKMLSTTPAKHINADNIGAVKVGLNADLVIADNDYKIIKVLKNGAEI
ncbi:MAG: N-acetylglucosamine-6-phosphate deacetylase [Clostridia bacterium]|nr:N-acetylglucosamine-6-phosphate deacetylase [Clostridia bacterium]